ncbi:fos-related antigen 2-like [Ptychodera flava]|uniref:fos-related antigen 2-like n=1 Tax=Ptychodera flava TaxID=63121 RepID=UPI00396A4336
MEDVLVLGCGSHVGSTSTSFDGFLGRDKDFITNMDERNVPIAYYGSPAHAVPWTSSEGRDTDESRGSHEGQVQTVNTTFTETNKAGGRCQVDRRKRQREKNRVAAAKSRGRKRERLDQLSKEAEKLEECHFKLRDEIRRLEREKNHLSLTLRIHELKCPLKNNAVGRTEISNLS